MKGYKVFNSDLTCRGFQFEIGKEYKHEGSFKICKSGFHFCTKASHCFSYYDFDSKNVVCEVEAIGDVQTHAEDSKVATNHLRIIRRLEWSEVLSVANEGVKNTGHSNTGNSNTGNSNTGNSNTGNSNTGNSNTGNSNTGNSNTGNWNTGNWNTGDRNTGYSNTGNRNTGAFGNIEPAFTLFNKKTSWTEQDFLNSRAYYLMRSHVDTKLWVPNHKMSDDEKAANIGWKNSEGFYKDITFKEAFQNAWNNWSEDSRKEFTSLPNFNSKVFFDITGVKTK